MDSVDCVIAEIEEVCGRDVQQRNIGPLAAHVRGSLARAARSIVQHGLPSIGIVTGFFLRDGAPPNCETDGPPGAAMLAAAFHRLGVSCRVGTDSLSAAVVTASLRGAGLGSEQVPLDVAAVPGENEAGVDRLIRRWRSADPAISHVIAIERCGPGHDGRPRSAAGEDMSDVNAPLERLFLAGPWQTIGIGDLGNEIGMGSLPADLVSRTIERGDRIRCTVPCDHPLVMGVSNWGAAALLGALALLQPAWSPALVGSLEPAFARRILEAAVRDAKAVSGGRGSRRPTPRVAVDGIPWQGLEPTFRRVHDLCRQHAAGASMQTAGPRASISAPDIAPVHSGSA